MGKTAIIFPGQGVQTVGMGLDVSQAHPAARAVFDEADRILGFQLSTICFDGPADRLNATDVSQPAILVTSVAIWRALEAVGQTARWAASAMAGLSLGEYTALHLAGWMEFSDCLTLVAERGRLMQAAAVANAGGMVSIIGLDEPAVQKLCDEAAGEDILAPANFNSPGQTVISGSKAACQRAVALAEKHGGRAVPLAVAGAFHSPLMESAARGLAGPLAATRIVPGPMGVVSNVTGDYHADPDMVRRLLGEQVVRPVRWQTSIERLAADGFDRFIEVGPGRVLTGLVKKINRAAKAVNVSTVAGVEQAAAEG